MLFGAIKKQSKRRFPRRAGVGALL